MAKFLLALALLVSGLTSLHGAKLDGPNSEQQANVCTSPSCVRAAAKLLRLMDVNQDPCDNFYRYSCGGFIESQRVDQKKVIVSEVSLVEKEIRRKLRGFLEARDAQDEPAAFKKLRVAYKSCMNKGANIDERGDEPLKKIINRLGGWPVLGEKSGWSDGREFDWLGRLIEMRKLGFAHNILLDLSVGPDKTNGSRNVLYLDQADFSSAELSNSERPYENRLFVAYHNYMVRAASLLGAEAMPQVSDELALVLHFETRLSRLTMPKELRRDMSQAKDRMGLAQLQELAPSVDWRRYLTEISGRQITDDTQVVVIWPEYFRGLDKLLRQTDSRLLANYMIWRVVLGSVHYLTDKWRDLDFSVGAGIFGSEALKPRWDQCLTAVGPFFDVALSSLYVRSQFESESRGAVSELVTYLRRELVKLLEDADWMDRRTKLTAIDKAESIRSYIGHPDEVLDEALVEQLYADLNFREDQYFGNMNRLRRWKTDLHFSELGETDSQLNWREHSNSATVNAFYDMTDNSIDLPAGILQGIFFEKQRPNYLNFGAIGSVIGHELTHGFDDLGRQFDKHGDVKNWWADDTSAKFRDKAQCIIDQYSKYAIFNVTMRVDGHQTQGENIADNGGLKTAYRAYESWVKDHREEPILPGLGLSQRQLFWVSAASTWCNKELPEITRMKLQFDTHSPEEFRVVGSLSNLNEFSEAFNCPLGSPMNPRKKCTVW